MKKISFIILVSLSALAICAFTFCSNNTASAADNGMNTAEKTPTAAVSNNTAKKAAKEKVESSSIPVSHEMGGLTWYTNLEEAHALSNKEGKPILGFFTGSDWCGWCKKLQANVLEKEEFKTWAEKNVVLMEIDFPRRTKLDSALQVQNNNLQQVFKVSGFPTVWYFNSEMNDETGQLNLSALGKTGYPRAQPGGEAAAFIAASDGILAAVK